MGDGDIIRGDATAGTLEAAVPDEVWAARKQTKAGLFPRTTVPLHEGADSGEIMPGSDEDFLFRTQK